MYTSLHNYSIGKTCPDCNEKKFTCNNKNFHLCQGAIKEEFGEASLEGLDLDHDGPPEEEELEMPPAPILYKLVDRLENQLPKDDTVKYDSR